MKKVLKIVLVVLLSVMAGSTHSCFVSQRVASTSIPAIQKVKQAQDVMEINMWTLTNKFNF